MVVGLPVQQHEADGDDREQRDVVRVGTAGRGLRSPRVVSSSTSSPGVAQHHGGVDAPPAVEAVGLTRRFGRGAGAVVAVDGLDLKVPAENVYGLIGPNGAGKTTAIRLLTGLLTPSGGRASGL
jgi:ABC-type glutathione transport system ATPase component